MHKYALLISCSLLMTAINAEETAPKTTIFDEARSGDRKAIRERLENDEDCSKSEENSGQTILHIAAENGDAELVELLTREPDRSGFTNWFYYCWYNYPKLPDKDKQDKNGDTAIHLSIQEGKGEATEILFKNGARTDILNKQNYIPSFMILKKNNPSLIPLLARYHCLDKKVKGKTVLHKAMAHNKPAIIHALLKEGSLIHEKDNKGRTLASIAAKNNHIPVLSKLIFLKININAPDSNGARPIHHGAYYGNYDVVRFILENKGSHEVTDNEGNDLAHYAAKGGNKDILNLLFSYKVDIKKRNNKGEDAFLIAIDKGHWSFAHDLVNKYGFNSNSCDNKGKTALIRAIEDEKFETMHGLLDLGTNLQLTDHDKENALHKAARLKDKKFAHFVLSKDRSLLEAKNSRGETPLFIAINEGYFDIAELLIQTGATVNTTSNDGSVPLLVAIGRGTSHEKITTTLLQSDASLMVADKNGNTALHIAAHKANHKILSIILEKRNKPHIDTLNSAGLTPLHCAAQSNNLPGMQLLEQWGASYNAITSQGNTIAHSSIEKDAFDTLAYIIAKHPHLLRSLNKNNEVPFIFACRMGASRCIEKMFYEREDEFINGNVERGAQIAYQHGNYATRDLIQKKIKERKKICAKIHDKYSTIISLGNNNQSIVGTLVQKDLSHLITWGVYAPSKPEYYTENQLYHMTESQRNKIYNQYLECENRERQMHTQFSDQLNTILSHEEAERIRAITAQQERERAARLEQERRNREQRERENFRREQDLNQAVAQKNAEIAQRERELAAQQQRQARELDPTAQQKELDYFKREKEKKDAAAIAAQKAQEEQFEREKKAADARRVDQQKQVAAAALQQQLWNDAQKHNQALQAQQAYTAMNLQPTAPEMEEQEEEENTIAVHYVHGKCCICTEDNMQVSTSPCSTCVNRKDYICKECLQECLAINKGKKIGNKCPLCTELTLNQELAEYIVAQQR